MKTINDFGVDYKERIENAMKQLHRGNGLVLVADAIRANEGDLISAAEKMTVKDMALMIRECSGIICLCLTPEKSEQLKLRQMVEFNDSKNQTAFTISIEAKEGVTTGVSAKDRIQTIKTAISETAKPEDLAHPGHVFPLTSKRDGVFERRGHTEGGIDLVKLSGLGDSAVLSELTNENGTMAKLPEIIDFAETHDMTVVTIEDIFQYRKQSVSIQ